MDVGVGWGGYELINLIMEDRGKTLPMSSLILHLNVKIIYMALPISNKERMKLLSLCTISVWNGVSCGVVCCVKAAFGHNTAEESGHLQMENILN